MLNTAWLIPLFPLVGALVNAALGRWLKRWMVATIACLAVGASFAMAVLVLVEMLGLPAESAAGGNGRERIIPIFSWIAAGSFTIEANLLLDQLSILMTLVVTAVSTVIHVYSAGYMKGEEVYNRYFTWLNLFVFMMLILVLGDNFMTMYVGWEGVGVCSYLLIGYWFDRGSAADAAKKAFIVNRVGDFGLFLGILLIFATFGSLAFKDVLPAAQAILPGTATAIALLLFLGAAGKSAQIPFYIWLPDAMEGPTPVSALIHAATMVTAGVYMVVRCHTLFEQSPSALSWVAGIGALTAILAALIAMVQTDFKRILAYSTVSQLGFMFLGVGAGAYASAMFHLTTHAAFKALLFLCAGSVMHALGGELDIFKMGRLRTKMPWTFATFLVAVLAISGVPLLSGSFSKDAILFNALRNGNLAAWLIGLVIDVLTAFYMFRLLLVAFYGRPPTIGGANRIGGRPQAPQPSSRKRAPARRAEVQALDDWQSQSHRGRVHESPPILLVPLVILAAPAAIGGLLGLPEMLGLGNAIEQFLEPILALPGTHPAAGDAALEWLTIIVSAVATGLGFVVAYWLYIRHWGLAERWTAGAPWLYDLLRNECYVDRAYTRIVVKPLRALGDLLADAVERRGIDAGVNGLARLVGLAGEGLRRVQTGMVRHYALAILAGVVAIVAWLIIQSVWG